MNRLAPPPVRHLYDDALAVLLAYAAPDAIQEQLRRGFLNALAADPMAVSKQGPPSHLTASCLVLSEDGGSVLLHLHAKARMWLQFGGHLETEDAGVSAGAAREAREESGLSTLDVREKPLDLDRHALGARFGDCAEHLDIRYLATAPAAALAQASSESLAVQWFPVDALPPQVGPDLPRLIAVGRQRLAAEAG